MTVKHRTDPSPEEWIEELEGEPQESGSMSHPDQSFQALKQNSRERIELEHEVMETLGDLRRAAGYNQTQIADRWGRGQSQVSKVERAPQDVELGTLAGYVRALGGQLSITVKVGELQFHEELLSVNSPSSNAGGKAKAKKLRAPHDAAVRAESGSRTRNSDGKWRKKRSDDGQPRAKR